MVQLKTDKSDPITAEVVRNKLEGIANEMQSTLFRSSFSPIVKEGLDASASLFTVDGETLNAEWEYRLTKGLRNRNLYT